MSWFTPSMLLENYKQIEMAAETLFMKNNNNDGEKREIVAEWRVPINGKLYKIEFVHGTKTGKRVLWINDEEKIRRDWMFKLVGDEIFTIENLRCMVKVDPAPGFQYIYMLYVNGKPYEQFSDHQAKSNKTWKINNDGKNMRFVLEKDSLNVWINGQLRDELGEFVDGGTDTTYVVDGKSLVLSARGSETVRQGVLHTLYLDGTEIDESLEN